MPYCSNCGAAESAGQKFCATCGTATSGDFSDIGPMPYFPMDKVQEESSAAYAGYWWRVLGYIIDALILAAVIAFPLRVIGLKSYGGTLVNVAFAFAYGSLLLTYMHGQTLGMRIAGIRVVDAVSHASITVRQVVIRTFIYCGLDLIGSLYHYTRYTNPDAHQKMLNAHHALVMFVLFIPIVVDLLSASLG